ncbi:MAG: hypothetical protein ACJ8F7_18860, partial [Gemmataceae bacterium]
MLFPYLRRLITLNPNRKQRSSLRRPAPALGYNLDKLEDRTVPTVTIVSMGNSGNPFTEGVPATSNANVTVNTDFTGLVTATVDYGDGSTDSVSVDVTAGTTTNVAFTTGHSYLFADEPNATGTFPVSFSVAGSDAVSDTASDSITNTVNNFIPTGVTVVPSSTSGSEGTFTPTITGSFSDPSTDTWTVTVDWGDGSTSTADVAPLGTGTQSYSAVHAYADDDLPGNPNGNSDVDTIRAVVGDDDGATGAGTADVTVSNVAPSGLAVTLAPTTINDGDTVTLTVTFTDAGVQDTFTASVNWGDGSANSTVAVPAGPGVSHSLTLSHVYADENPPGPNSTDTVSVTVVDDDGSSVGASTSVVVNEALPAITGIATSVTRVPEGNAAPPVTLTVSFTDPSPTATFTATVNFGDGTTQSLALAAGANPHTFTVAHRYADDADTGPTTLETISVNLVDDGGVTMSSSTSVTVVDTNMLAEATDAGSVPAGVGATVKVYGDDGDLFYTLHPFGNFFGGLRVAMGDVNGDLVPDIIVTAGGGGGPRIE